MKQLLRGSSQLGYSWWNVSPVTAILLRHFFSNAAYVRLASDLCLFASWYTSFINQRPVRSEHLALKQAKISAAISLLSSLARKKKFFSMAAAAQKSQ